MDKKTGGPAFPSQADVYKSEETGTLVRLKPEGCDGMTLRDWFAGQALTGMLASAPVADRSKPNHKGWAANAYAFADAMLAERSKP